MIEENSLINIEQEYYEYLFDGRLCPSQRDIEGKKRKEYPFQTMWELFVYAVTLGVKYDKSKPIIRPHKPFRWINIPHNHQKNLLILIVSKSNSLEILRDGDIVKKNIEEFANGGLSIINQELKNNLSAFSNLESLTFKVIQDM